MADGARRKSVKAQQVNLIYGGKWYHLPVQAEGFMGC